MAKRNNTAYARALYEITKGLSGAKLSEALAAFVQLLARHQRLKQAPAIMAEFERVARAELGLRAVTVTVAHAHDKIMAAVKKIFGESAEITVQENPEILGGVIVKTGDQIFDGSLKKQLQLLQNQLIH